MPEWLYFHFVSSCFAYLNMGPSSLASKTTVFTYLLRKHGPFLFLEIQTTCILIYNTPAEGHLERERERERERVVRNGLPARRNWFCSKTWRKKNLRRCEGEADREETQYDWQSESSFERKKHCAVSCQNASCCPFLLEIHTKSSLE